MMARRMGVLACGLVLGSSSMVVAQSAAPKQLGSEITQALQEARQVVANARSAADSLKAQVGEARDAHDVIKALCLSDNRKQLQAAERTSRERLNALQAAVTNGQLVRARHEHAVLSALGERIEAITKQAAECVGDESSSNRGSELVVAVSAGVPGVDPSSSVVNPFGGVLSLAAFDPDSISPPPIVATPID
jgi:sensor histidine kinase regulating citrate/malate metabolism